MTIIHRTPSRLSSSPSDGHNPATTPAVSSSCPACSAWTFTSACPTIELECPVGESSHVAQQATLTCSAVDHERVVMETSHPAWSNALAHPATDHGCPAKNTSCSAHISTDCGYPAVDTACSACQVTDSNGGFGK